MTQNASLTAAFLHWVVIALTLSNESSARQWVFDQSLRAHSLPASQPHIICLGGKFKIPAYQDARLRGDQVEFM